MDFSRELTVAIEVARATGAMLLASAQDAATGVTSKSSITDLVSDADRRAERSIVTALHDAFPEDDVVAEEGSLVRGTSGRRWYVDPLDGTINYIYTIPHWSVALAFEDASGTLAGVVFDPNRGETFAAERGKGAWLGSERLGVSSQDNLALALVATGFGYVAEYRAAQAELLPRVLPAVRDIRRFGSAALDLAWLSAARIDAYFETGVQPWDVAAGALLVLEAGGMVTNVDGIGVDRRAGIVASNAHLHAALMTLVGASRS